jgi:GWxTD domain-containing protein
MTKRITRGLVVLLALAGLALPAAARAQDMKDPAKESKEFYKTARLIMTSQESKIWKHLPDEASRQEFIRDFWAKRDPDPDTEENEFKAEFEGRIDYANKHFREGGLGMNTDRGRIYIFMGPPDKFEEFYTHEDTSIRGPILWWIYYADRLGIEFVDERGYGTYKIRQYDGDFFGAMQDMVKLGQWVGPDSVFRKRIVDFDLDYDTDAKAIDLSIPAKNLLLKENDEGAFQVDLDFIFYIYGDEGRTKDTVRESRTFIATVREVDELKTVPFRFDVPLKRGTNFVDVIIKGKTRNSGKVRRIFEIKVKS